MGCRNDWPQSTGASLTIDKLSINPRIGVVANATGVAGDALKGMGNFTLDALGNVTGTLGELVGKKGGEEAEKEPEKKKKKHRFRWLWWR